MEICTQNCSQLILCDLYAHVACSGEEHLPLVNYHAEHLHNIVHGLECFATFNA